MSKVTTKPDFFLSLGDETTYFRKGLKWNRNRQYQMRTITSDRIGSWLRSETEEFTGISIYVREDFRYNRYGPRTRFTDQGTEGTLQRRRIYVGHHLVGLQGFNSDGSLRYCRGLNWDEFLKWDGNRQMKFCLTNRSSVRTTDDLPLRDDEKTESYKLCWNGKGGDR